MKSNTRQDFIVHSAWCHSMCSNVICDFNPLYRTLQILVINFIVQFALMYFTFRNISIF